MIGQEAAQKRQMRLAPCGDPFVIVAIGDRAAHRQQQHLRQRVCHPPRLARILNYRKMVEQGPNTRLFWGNKNGEVHGVAPNHRPHN
jgi:hypothetical protein